MFSSAYQSMSPGRFGPGGVTGMPDLSGGFNPMGIGGRVNPMGPPTGGGGWLGAVQGADKGMSGYEMAFLALSGLSGVADYFGQKSDRDFQRRQYEDSLEERRKHREAMGRSLTSAWGGG